MKIGILALQGAFIEHKHSLDALGVESFEIRQKKDIEKPFDGLIIPGGESTESANFFTSSIYMSRLKI